MKTDELTTGDNPMKQHLRILALISIIVLSYGCFDRIVGSGDEIPVTKGFTDFDRISISHGCEATVTRDDNYHVEVVVDDNISNYLNIVKEGRTLKIYLDPGHTYSRYTLEADITLPHLEKISQGGGSVATLSGFSSDYNFEADLSGASELTGDMEANDFDLQLSGASEIALTGTGDDVDVQSSGASILDLSDLPVDDAEVEMSGGGKATLRLEGTLNARLSGGSDLYYYGNPTLGSIYTSGGSTVQRKG